MSDISRVANLFNAYRQSSHVSKQVTQLEAKLMSSLRTRQGLHRDFAFYRRTAGSELWVVASFCQPHHAVNFANSQLLNNFVSMYVTLTHY